MGVSLLGRQIIFPLRFFQTHSAGEAPNNYRHRHARAPNDRFAMAYLGVDENSIIQIRIPCFQL